MTPEADPAPGPRGESSGEPSGEPSDGPGAGPLDDPAWRAHLFAVHDEEQLGRWVRSLRWFRYCRATPSPFLTEPDRLLVALAWRNTTDRDGLLARLGLAPAQVARPGWCTVAGHRVHVRVHPGRLELAVSGAEQRRVPVVERDVVVAQQLEDEVVGGLADRVVDPPIDDRSCLTPDRYARLFGDHR